ncbi:putative nuclease HARBI1 [Ixodes scapularis]|uniref:putative nuclease HARBI1 n=1 Tax=Ixodes scapularis TaxID=6945 RepID=UPI001C38977D|nr:putative nuclease HARBI1 [Ixodes scapularis]
MFADSTFFFFFFGEDSDQEDYQDSIDVRWTQGRCRSRQVRPRDDPFYRYDDVDFITRFRLSKNVTIRLLSRIEHAVLADLWDVHKSTVRQVVKRVTHAIAALARVFISFPTTAAERRIVSEGFYSMHRFPGVVGAIDCTHVPIQLPGGDHAGLYRNRTGYFSINVQRVSDHLLCIRNIVVRWPGSVNASTIFGNSALKALFESGQMNESILLGDGGYACSWYLFTPVAAPKTPAETAYNRAHIPTRSTVERQYGVWKRRFPALEFGLRIKLETALFSIMAMAVVHNSWRYSWVKPNHP